MAQNNTPVKALVLAGADVQPARSVSDARIAMSTRERAFFFMGIFLRFPFALF